MRFENGFIRIFKNQDKRFFTLSFSCFLFSIVCFYKKIFMIWFLSCLFLLVNPVFAKDFTPVPKQGKSSPSVIKTVKKKKKSPSLTTSRDQIKKGQSAGRFPALSPILGKMGFLLKKQSQPRYPAGVLKEGLDTLLGEISSACSPQETASALNHLRDFLKDKLQDPYMDDEMEILFSNILMITGEDSSSKALKLRDFKRSYKVAFRIQGEIDPSDYPEWAISIEKALTCVEESAVSE